MSSGLTVARSGAGSLDGGPAFGAPLAAGAPEAEPVLAGAVPDVPLDLLGAAGFAPDAGAAAALAATSNDENATTVEVARIPVLQPALAGALDGVCAAGGGDAFACRMLQL
jgi:hypothetical protein